MVNRLYIYCLFCFVLSTQRIQYVRNFDTQFFNMCGQINKVQTNRPIKRNKYKNVEIISWRKKVARKSIPIKKVFSTMF